jgi:hypothetical protein
MIPLPNNLVSVQPMNGPSGHVFYLDYNYGHMENTAMNISPFLTNLQFSNVMPGIRDIDSYKLRIESTVKKLDSLLHSLHQFEGLPGRLPYGGWHLDHVTISTIRDTIGVYSIIPQKERELFNSTILWYKDVSGLNIRGQDELHSTWQDWLGDRAITQLGGKVVVSLSDEGVNQLNEIADRVSSYTTEPPIFGPRANNLYTYRD